MARVTVSVSEVARTCDLQRFLDLLDAIGIDPFSDHPISVSVTGEISARTSTSFLTLPGDELANPDNQEL